MQGDVKGMEMVADVPMDCRDAAWLTSEELEAERHLRTFRSA